MPVDANGCWGPAVFPKQLELMRLCREPSGTRKYVLCNGPRWAAKSWGCLHAVADHAWNTNGGSICVLCTSVPAGSSSGIWTLLTENVLLQWIDGDFGFDWAEIGIGRWKNQKCTPRADGTTKKLYCYVTNKFGGKTRIELNSLKDERDVEKEFKNRYFSMIYWSELSNFQDRATFDTLCHALRMPGVPEEDHLLLADTNPSDVGEDYWGYKLWYETRIARPEDLGEHERPIQRNLKLIEFTIDDNLSLDENRKKEILASFAHDPDLMARYGYGKWVKASSNALFLGKFKPSIHIIGDSKESDPEMLVPQEDCTQLYGGWDPGSANPAFSIFEKVFRTVLITRVRDGKEVQEWVEQSVFKFIDELAFVKESFSIGEFTEFVMEKVIFWEKWLGREVAWTHWSDRSAFDQRESISNRYVYEEVYSVSGGKILLQAHEKSQIRGTKAPSIRLWKKLLFQDRLFFSAAMTPKIIEMNKVLRRDTRKGMPVDSVDKAQNERHIFDCCRYGVQSECWEELQESIITMETDKRPEPKLMSVRL
jgi:hypothetical protein